MRAIQITKAESAAAQAAGVSTVVDRAAQAVEKADKQGAAKPSESAEVRAAPKAAAWEKITEAEKAAAKSAEQKRGKPRSCGPVQVQRAQRALKGAKATPESVVRSFKSMKQATAWARGDKEVEQPALVKEISSAIEDPFARGRGLVAICLALELAR